MDKYLIIKPSSLGDIIHGLQVAETLKQENQGCHISWIVRDIFAPIVQHCTAVDQIFVFERDQGIAGFLKLIKEIRKHKFDKVFDMQGLLRSGILTFFAKSPIKIGRSDSREGASVFYTKKVPLPFNDKKSHALEILLEMTKDRTLKSKLSFDSKIKNTSLLNSLKKGEKVIVMFPESRRAEKCWPYFEELTKIFLTQNKSTKIVWMGTNRTPVDTFGNKEQFLDCRNECDLSEIPEILQQATLVIANDSGPMHLAAAMQIPLIALFGPTNPECYGPYPLDSAVNTVIASTSQDIKDIAIDSVIREFNAIF
tara:strand:- start:765 stop:1697 length:933 start_codon:yes stop_codon:yes gene_type:complete